MDAFLVHGFKLMVLTFSAWVAGLGDFFPDEKRGQLPTKRPEYVRAYVPTFLPLNENELLLVILYWPRFNQDSGLCENPARERFLSLLSLSLPATTVGLDMLEKIVAQGPFIASSMSA